MAPAVFWLRAGFCQLHASRLASSGDQAEPPLWRLFTRLAIHDHNYIVLLDAISVDRHKATVNVYIVDTATVSMVNSFPVYGPGGLSYRALSWRCDETSSGA